MNGRGLMAIAILAAWGVGITAYTQRVTAPRTPRERLAEAAMRVAPGATYFAVERGSGHVGFASSTVDTIPGGLQVTDYLVADLLVGETLRRATAQSAVRLSRALALRDFSIAFGRDGAPTRAWGRTVADTLLEYVVLRPGQRADTTRVRLSGPLLLPTLVPMAVALGDPPAVGQRHQVETFDPVQLAVRRLTLTIRAETLFVVVDSASFDPNSRRWLGAHADTVRAFHLVADAPDAYDAWIDAQGRILRVSTPLALSMRRTAYEVAFENWRTASPLRGGARGAASAASTFSAPSGATTAGAAAGASPARWTTTTIGAGIDTPPVARDTVTWLARGLDLRRFALPEQRVQQRGDTLILAAFPHAMLRPTTPMLPFPRAMRERFAPELRREPMLEVDHPAVAALAKRLRGGRVLVDDVAWAITGWMRDSVAKEATGAMPSAVGTLRSRTGDVADRAQLFVALARAAGIPARTVSGIVSVDGRFYLHAWAEVMLRDWIPVDPTLSQFPADAAHLRLLVGSLGAQAELARALEPLDLTILSETSPRARRAARR